MTLLTNLTNAGLPVSAASEDGNEITWSAPPSDEQMQSCRDIVREYIDPVGWAELLQERADVQNLKDLYQTMITRYEQIENAGAIPFTQAGFNQVVQAVKDEATFGKRILKALKILARLSDLP